MAGREDFAIIRARLLSDPRAHHAAALYVERNLALATTALAAAVGHVAMLGIVASRDTDDGVFEGDGVPAIALATMTYGTDAKTIRSVLLDAGLLREISRRGREGTYLVGFRACYEPVIRKRRADAKRKRERRISLETSGWTSDGHPTDVQRTNGGRPDAPDRTGPDRTEGKKNPPKPPQAGTGGEWTASLSDPDPYAAASNGHVTEAVLAQDREEAARAAVEAEAPLARIRSNAWAVEVLRNPSAPFRDDAAEVVRQFELGTAEPDEWLDMWREIQTTDPMLAKRVARAVKEVPA